MSAYTDALYEADGARAAHHWACDPGTDDALEADRERRIFAAADYRQVDADDAPLSLPGDRAFAPAGLASDPLVGWQVGR